MKTSRNIAGGRWLMVVLALWVATVAASAQELRPDSLDADSAAQFVDSLAQQSLARIDSLARVANLRKGPSQQPFAAVDTAVQRRKAAKRDWSTWRPDPKRALWLALVIPGGGQIYNRKYWKLPIVYGGFMGCAYAMSWNNMMYKDYAQAYLDIMDDDPGTASYNQFLHLGQQITSANEARYKEIFRKRKDRYRRWRDMSFFVMVGVYAISVIDAYVDAELSVFDISRDLSLKVEPTILNNNSTTNPLYASSIGVQCSLNF